MNTNYTIPAFAEPITSLPDTPTCEAAELKRRFQAPADEVREAHNALAEAHEALDTKVEGIVTETFAGAIHESMFDEELTKKLNGKADEASVAERLEAETAAREQTDAAVALKCRMVCGSYTGDDSASRTITVGFAPKAVLVVSSEARIREDNAIWGGLALAGSPVKYDAIVCTSNGFQVKLKHDYSVYVNLSGHTYFYIAFE
ncbi:MAG: hypothetical protein Q3Y08_05155 [Butyricicoccus sp.]|nr:hypothetical protein [Butyricicoccus sp.]